MSIPHIALNHIINLWSLVKSALGSNFFVFWGGMEVIFNNEKYMVAQYFLLKKYTSFIYCPIVYQRKTCLCPLYLCLSGFFHFFILIFIILPTFFKDNEHESIARNTCEFRKWM